MSFPDEDNSFLDGLFRAASFFDGPFSSPSFPDVSDGPGRRSFVEVMRPCLEVMSPFVAASKHAHQRRAVRTVGRAPAGRMT